jgi:ABC-type sugar transport system substrate-binding protein
MEVGTPLTQQIIVNAAAHHVKLALDAVYPGAVSGPVIDSSAGYSQLNLMGKLVADEFILASAGRGKAIEEAVPSLPLLTAFRSGFQSQVRANCPRCRVSVVNVTTDQILAGQMASVLVAALRRDPAYSYLVFDNGPFADGITTKLSAAGLSDIHVLGEAGDLTGLQALEQGSELAWTGYSVPFAAWQMMDAAFRDAEGMRIPAADSTEPTQLVTQANVARLGLNTESGGWNYPTDGLSQFRRLWHLG